MPLEGRWENEHAAVREQLTEISATPEAGDDDAGVSLATLDDLPGIRIFLVSGADEYEFPIVYGGSLEGINEIELSLNLIEPRYAKCVAALANAELIEHVRGRRPHGPRHSVRNQPRSNAVPAAHRLLQKVRDDDGGVGVTHAHSLTGRQQKTSQSAPLLSTVIGGMVRDNHAQTQEPGERGQQRRTDAVQVQNVGALQRGVTEP